MPLPAYAQNAEDVMLWRLFRDQKTGTFVDVGAQDPEVDSVTKHFYDHGWSGLNIEPVTAYYEALQSARPRDINLNVLAGAIDGELTFYHVEGTGLSTTRADLAELYRREGRKVREETCSIFRLQTLFDRHGITSVDFLKIDTEGSEADVLKGLDYTSVRPKVMVIESTVPNSREENHHEWEPELLKNGYHLVYRDGLNRFYVDTPYLDWRQHFDLPPNVFDDFLPALTVRERKDTARERAFADEMSTKAQAELVGMVRALEAHIAQQHARLDEQQDLLEHRAAFIDHQKAHIEQQQARLDVQQGLLEHRQVFIEQQKKHIAQQEQDRKHDHSIIAKQQKEIEDLQVNLAKQVEYLNWHLRHTIENLNHEIAQRDYHISLLHADMARVSAELHHVRHVHEGAMRSRSWRLTAPLRSVPNVTQNIRALARQTTIPWPTRSPKPVAPSHTPGPPPVDSMPEAGRWLLDKARHGS